MTMGAEAEPFRLLVINAGVSDPSSTRMLTDRVAQQVVEQARAAGRSVSLSILDLAPLAADIARAMVAGFANDAIAGVLEKLATADAVIAGTPIYKAGLSGLFKSFIDLLDNDALVARPMILVATAGTARHAMVVDEQMRPLFAFMRALPVPTGLFASPDDWGSPDFTKRIGRAATELVQFMLAGIGPAIRDQAWQSYQHQFGGSVARSEQAAEEVNFDTDLMRLAAGGNST